MHDNLREDVVNHVEINDTVEDLATDEAEWPINGGQSSVQESPSISLVVVAVWVSVVKVSDSHC